MCDSGRYEHRLIQPPPLVAGVRKCCSPIGPCSGEMVIYFHDKTCPIWNGGDCNCWVSDEVWVAAHNEVCFAQCNGCGHAPSSMFKSARKKSRKR